MTPEHIFSFGMLLCGCLLCAQEITNADLSGWSGKKPAFWTVDGSGLELKKNDNNGLEVKILSEGKLDSAIHQRVVGLPANKAYRFSAEIDAPAKCAYIQVKLYRDKRELKRMDSGLNRHAGKTLLKVDFNTGDYDLALLCLRTPMKGNAVGKSVVFSNLKLSEQK